MSLSRLPQHDTNAARSSDLAQRRSEYTFNFDFKFPIGSKFYPRDKPSKTWVVKFLKTLFQIRSNLEHVVQNTRWTFTKEIPTMAPADLAAEFINNDLKSLLEYYNPDLGPRLPNGRPQSLEDYKALFAQFPVPTFVEEFKNDKFFAQTFVAGANPILLMRQTVVHANFPLTQSQFEKAPGFAGDSLSAALSEGRIYFADYKELSSLVPGVHPQQRKHSFSQIIAFGIPRGSREMAPIAIQCGQSPADFSMFGPEDGWSWQIAKSVIAMAHYCYHELLSHLGFTHLLIEPIVVSTRRQLHESHPIYALLDPHFEGTMPINFLAVTKLIQPGEAVDRLVAGEKQSNYDLIATQRLSYSFSGNYPPTRFQRMGVSDANILPDYPYRDDAMLLWDAILNWTTAYVNHFYLSTADIEQDSELQSWAKEISSDSGGRIRDFAGNGNISDRTQLAETLAMIIFTCGPQHAAVNFPQATFMSYLPAAPMAGYTDAPASRDLTEKDWLAFLPPVDVALQQLHTGMLLGSLHHTVLGQYPIGQFIAPPVLLALAVFQERLLQIEAHILTSNASRTPYEHLLPTRIPQSINV